MLHNKKKRIFKIVYVQLNQPIVSGLLYGPYNMVFSLYRQSFNCIRKDTSMVDVEEHLQQEETSPL